VARFTSQWAEPSANVNGDGHPPRAAQFVRGYLEYVQAAERHMEDAWIEKAGMLDDNL
jgi:hypothetical protein